MHRFIVCHRSKAGDRLDSGRQAGAGAAGMRVVNIQKLKVKREQRLGKGFLQEKYKLVRE